MSTSVLRETSAQCGAPVSVSVTVAGADSAAPSLAVKVKRVLARGVRVRGVGHGVVGDRAERALRRAVDDRERQRIAVRIGAGQRHRRRSSRPARSLATSSQVGGRVIVTSTVAGARLGGAVGGAVGERVARRTRRRRRVGDLAVLDRAQRAVRRAVDDRELERVLVEIRALERHLYRGADLGAHRHVLAARRARDRDRHRRWRRVGRAVAGAVGEGVVAELAGVRRVGDLVAGDRAERALRGSVDDLELQRVRVRIGARQRHRHRLTHRRPSRDVIARGRPGDRDRHRRRIGVRGAVRRGVA